MDGKILLNMPLVLVRIKTMKPLYAQAPDQQLHHILVPPPPSPKANNPRYHFMPYLCVGDDADDLCVLLDALKLSVDLFRGLRELLCVPREGLLLRLVPVLVEPAHRRRA